MTVCIAGLCDDANSVVVAADRMVTASHPALEFEHSQSKIVPLTPVCHILSSGDALAHAQIAGLSLAQIGSLQRPSVLQIAEAVRHSYVSQRQARVAELYLTPRAWTLEDFYRIHARSIPENLFLAVDNSISSYNFGLDLIIAGTDPTEGHIYGLRHPGQVDCYDALGYYAIGIGAQHAIASLVRNGYSSQLSSEEALFYIYEAKRAAESAPGVGLKTDMIHIQENEGATVSDGKIDRLRKLHEVREKPIDKLLEDGDAETE